MSAVTTGFTSEPLGSGICPGSGLPAFLLLLLLAGREVPNKGQVHGPNSLFWGVHARNRFRDGYDFERLVEASPELDAFVGPTAHGHLSINFADPAAVLALNQALLKDAYGLQWSLPRAALCPPIPGRLDYLHHLADLLQGDAKRLSTGAGVSILDIGMGANAIYPMLGASEFGWKFVGTEIDKSSLHWARQIIRINPTIAKLIECRHQTDPSTCFKGVTSAADRFDASICNPPFHASAAEAAAGTQRKLRNLGIPRAERSLNFGGQAGELWCRGGEVGFIERMIAESATRPQLCRWFTTLVSKSEHLPHLRRFLKEARVSDAKTIEMAQGSKKSRILAWTFTSRS